MKLNIEGRVIVMTGADRGMGAAAAKLLAARGAAMVLGARRMEELEIVLRTIYEKGGKAVGIKTDVSNPYQVKNLVRRAVEEFGKVDVVINNAGLMPTSPVQKLRIPEWNQLIDVNFKGVLYGIAAALPYMKKQKSGHIINTASVLDHTTKRGFAIYSATKRAVQALSEGLRQEVEPYNIQITVLSPGMIDMKLTNMMNDENLTREKQQLYSQNKASIDSFAWAVFFAVERPGNMDASEIVFRPSSSKMQDFTFFINFLLLEVL